MMFDFVTFSFPFLKSDSYENGFLSKSDNFIIFNLFANVDKSCRSAIRLQHFISDMHLPNTLIPMRCPAWEKGLIIFPRFFTYLKQMQFRHDLAAVGRIWIDLSQCNSRFVPFFLLKVDKS